MNAPTLHTVLGQPSWSFRSNLVTAHLTRLGGHLGPVAFRLGRKTVEPFSVAPWAEEKLAADTPNILRVLRGDFFCAPFGGNAARWRGEKHPPHGESANEKWSLLAFDKSGDRLTLHARLETKLRPGLVDKQITLIKDHTALYQRHTISGARGPMNLGHHAMLKFPETPGSGAISTSRFVRGQVCPVTFETPEHFGYQSLRPGASFRSLDRVPQLDGGTADLSLYPARRGFEDLVMLTADAKLDFAWTAVAFPNEGYVWFSLRDPSVLRHTVFWISNGGRHYAPWNSRHTAVMGLEDVTSYFHFGLAESAKPNPINRAGFPTTVALDPKKPTTIPYIMAVAAIPSSFDRVASIRPVSGGVELTSVSGQRVPCALDLSFLNVENT